MKTIHPTRWRARLPIWWTSYRDFGRFALARPVWMKELDYPYRRGRGVALRTGRSRNVQGWGIVEVGVCWRLRAGHPDDHGDYSDVGTMEAIGGRILTSDPDVIYNEYRGTYAHQEEAEREGAEPSPQDGDG